MIPFINAVQGESKGADAEVKTGCIPSDLGGRNKRRPTVANTRSAIHDTHQSFIVLICHEQLIRVSCFLLYTAEQSLTYLTGSLISFMEFTIENEEVTNNGKNTDYF